MQDAAVVQHISPMFAAADMAQTVGFYREVFGFTVVMDTPGYSILERDGQTIHISAPASEETLASMRKHTAIYLEVVALLRLWERVKTFAVHYKTREPFEREYGMTEFHIHDPNGCLIFVGEPTAAIWASE